MDRNSREFQALLRVHHALPRQGPGSRESTAQALNSLPAIPEQAVIYDLGCGPGQATLVLALKLQKKVVAVDLVQDYLLQLQVNANALGLAGLIEVHCADMRAPGADAESIDLIWSEGAIYCIGFDNGLRLWRQLLKTNGLIACTELSWLTNQRDKQPSDFWQAAYPGMRSISENISAAENHGYKCLGHFVLPNAAWWDEYYNPLRGNIDKLKAEIDHSEELEKALANATAEIDLFKQFSDQYGYVFYLLEKRLT